MTKKLTRQKFIDIAINHYEGVVTLNCIANELEKLGYIEPEKEPLTFERIRKECVSGESVLIDDKGYKRVYVGFTKNGNLVIDHDQYGVSTWYECHIVSWTIKPKEEKKTIEIDKEVWVNVYENGKIFIHDRKLDADSFNGRIACEKFHLKRSVEV